MNRKFIIYTIIFFFLINVFPIFAASSFEGKVIRVSDGDTIWVQTSRGRKKIRLYGIDSPEMGQPYYEQAKNVLKKLIFKKHVGVIRMGRDRYGRIIGVIYLGNLNINKEMLKRGFAWVHIRYTRKRSYYRLQKRARKERKGLWNDSNPVPPWRFKRPGGGCKIKKPKC